MNNSGSNNGAGDGDPVQGDWSQGLGFQSSDGGGGGLNFMMPRSDSNNDSSNDSSDNSGRIALDYSKLDEARKDLHALADQIGPMLLMNNVFSEIGANASPNDGGTQGLGFQSSDGGGGGVNYMMDESWTPHDDVIAVFGDPNLAASFRIFYRRAKEPMESARKRLTELGDLIGGVADAFFNADSETAAVLGAQEAVTDLGAWQEKKEMWDYRQSHTGECVPDAQGNMPGFCSATDPGPPPTDHTLKFDGGEMHTHLTLGDNYKVTEEATTIKMGDQTFALVVKHDPDGRSSTSETTYPDGGKEFSDIRIKEDGSGTMKTTDPDGKVTEYTRSGKDAEWVKVGSGGAGVPGAMLKDPKEPRPSQIPNGGGREIN